MLGTSDLSACSRPSDASLHCGSITGLRLPSATAPKVLPNTHGTDSGPMHTRRDARSKKRSKLPRANPIVATGLFTLQATSNAWCKKQQNGTWLHFFVSRRVTRCIQCAWGLNVPETWRRECRNAKGARVWSQMVALLICFSLLSLLFVQLAFKKRKKEGNGGSWNWIFLFSFCCPTSWMFLPTLTPREGCGNETSLAITAFVGQGYGYTNVNEYLTGVLKIVAT